MPKIHPPPKMTFAHYIFSFNVEHFLFPDPTQNDPKFTVTQPENIMANEGTSVTISCSYTVPPDRNLLWSGVFWRVGSPTGPYAYHPSDLMVHPSYSGRTQLNGSTDLQINGAQDTDITTYYCFVMLKFCIGTNKTNSVLKYGSGTQLYRNVKNQTSTGINYFIFFILIKCANMFMHYRA